MKKVLFVAFLLMCAASSMGQFGVDLLRSTKKFDADVLTRLKGTTAVFFMKADKEATKDSLKQAISSAWDLTPIIFANFSKFDQYASDPKYSYFIIEGSVYESKSMSSTHYYLTLRLFDEVGRKGKINTFGLARIELYPDFKTLNIGSFRRDPEEVISRLYEDGNFYNWSPILLKANLEVVSTNLKSNMRQSLFEDHKSGDLSQILSKDTLYVSKTLLMSFNGFTGKEAAKDEDFFSDYKYAYKICTDGELYSIFEVQKRGRLLFEYVKSSTDKFITVFDVQNKQVIYREYKAISYNLKSKDIEKIR